MGTVSGARREQALKGERRCCRGCRAAWTGSCKTTQVLAMGPPAQGDHDSWNMVAQPMEQNTAATCTLPQFDGRRNHEADAGIRRVGQGKD